MQRRTGNSASESKKQDSVVTSLKMQPRGFLFPNRIVVWKLSERMAELFSNMKSATHGLQKTNENSSSTSFEDKTLSGGGKKTNFSV